MQAGRQALRNLMPANSVAVIFAYPEQVFSNDVNYVYHPNPDLYYFSGYTEPDAALLIFKDAQGTGDSSYNEVLFVRKRDAQREQWTGRRLGVDGAKAQLGFKRVYNGSEFAKFPIDFKKFTPLYDDNLSDDASGDLKGLISTFKTKAAVPEVDKALMNDFNVIDKYATAKNISQIMNYSEASP
jgi:Xaa-Pro aminopeptidase